MNFVDLSVLLFLSLFALRGYFKGFFREASSLLGFVIGLTVAVRYDEPLAALWKESWDFSFILLRALAFLVLFLVVYILFSLVGWLFHRAAKLSAFQAADRVGGVALGAGKGAFVLALAVFFLVSFPLMPTKTKQRIDEAYLAPPLYHLGQELIRLGRASLFPQEEPQAARRASDSFRYSG